MLLAIRDWFLTYDKLDKDGRIYADHVPVKHVNYSIIQSPSGQSGVIREYMDSQLKQFQFEFDTVSPYSQANSPTNFNNAKFYEELEEWIYTQNRLGNLPEVEGIQSIEVIRTGYLKAVHENGQSGVYSMSARITYLKERNTLFI